MEILKSAQFYEFREGEIVFAYTKVLLKVDGRFCIGRYPDAVNRSHLTIDDRKLTVITAVPLDSYCPPYHQFTMAPSPLPPNCYVKRPNIMQADGDTSLRDLVLKDLKACEILRANPHRNIAQYYGCQVHNDLVTGLCFAHYNETLMDKLNPKGLSKDAFLQTSDEGRVVASRKYLTQIEGALRHMHNLGLVHNDINPSNIMIDLDDTPVIIDFDSCLPYGTALGITKRTYGWYDTDVETSIFENDWRALDEIRIWLTGSIVSAYQFR